VPGSSRKINYLLRPAKNIERKMLVEAFRCLKGFGRLNSYQYVGFGSHFFSDFKLIHRSLGVPQMINIEADEEARARFEFNRPFTCIQLKFGSSTSVLPKLDLKRKTILWLDYDNPLNPTVLNDVKTACTKAVSGSVLVVTVDTRVEPPSNPDDDLEKTSSSQSWLSEDDDPEKMRKYLTENLGNRVPPGIRNKDFVGWRTAAVYRTIIDNEIRKTLSDRNGALKADKQIQYQQLFNFEYQDTAKMLTVGGLLYEKRHAKSAANCDFASLFFVRSDKKPYRIVFPTNLTLDEIRYLDKNLPRRTSPPRGFLISRGDMDAYAEVYRYFPAFVEAEL
jgi:hypothetical protein